jgi:hypothetical protein
MNGSMKESDWKVFKELHEVALGRYFERMVAEMRGVLGDERLKDRDKFWTIVERAREAEQELRGVFDDFRRSTAEVKVLLMVSAGLVREDELARFSEELRGKVKTLPG